MYDQNFTKFVAASVLISADQPAVESDDSLLEQPMLFEYVDRNLNLYARNVYRVDLGGFQELVFTFFASKIQ